MKAEEDLLTLLMKFLRIEWIKFLFTGGINTIVTYLFYLLLVAILNYHLAYIISYIIGIIVSYTLNTIFVFKTNFSIKKMVSFPLVYIFQFVASYFLVAVLIEFEIVSEIFAPIIVTVTLIPFTYFLSKFILKRK